MRRGGSFLLLLPDLDSAGGIQQHSRNVMAALAAAGTDTSTLVLHGPPTAAEGARAFAGRRWAFAAAALAAAVRGRTAVALLGHRGFLSLAPLLRLVAPRVRLWLAAYGVEVEPRFGRFERLALRCVERVVAISPWTGELVRAGGYRGQVDLLPCSLPPGVRAAEVDPPRFGDRLRLLTVTRLASGEAYKGVDMLIAAVGQLRKLGIRAELRLVGDGDDRSRLGALAESCGVARHVSFLGRIDAARRDEEYASCDVFVLPSAREGFGLVFLEAMLHARPVVACATGGAPFVVRRGVSGLLARPGDVEDLVEQIASLARDPSGARALGQRGRDLAVSEFSFERLVERMAHLSGAQARSVDD